ncbi:phosphotransferase [Virgisporangium ochraceum]|nr:phosphotransferase [Virgisporangium ochraceum]
MEGEQPGHAADVPLPAGRMTPGVVRRGGQVLRPMGSWSGGVHEYLGHLESVGFDGAPRLLGTEGPREVLTFIEGDVPVDPQWTPGRGNRLPSYARSDASLVGAARLLRRLHEAARGFQPVDTGYRFHPHPPRAGEIVSHGDLGPWNTVYRDGVPVAFIDWDCAGPVEPVVDLAAAAWEFVPLAPPEVLGESGFDPVPDIAVRLRLFTDAYGIDDRRTVVPALQRSRLLTADRIKYAPLTPAEAAENLEFRAQELRWLHSMVPLFDSELAS